MVLPQKLDLSLMQTRWASMLNPVLANPVSTLKFINNVSLVSGANVINHRVGYVPRGWFLVDTQGAATVYRSSPFNEKTLTLTASAPVTVSIGVF